MHDFGRKREKSRPLHHALTTPIWPQSSSLLKLYNPWSQERKLILLWPQKPLVLTVPRCRDDSVKFRTQKTQYNNQRLLNDEQSKKLIQWINQLTERGLPPTTLMLANLAQEISSKEPGKNWASRWLKAHSDKVISRYSTGLDSDRKRADSA